MKVQYRVKKYSEFEKVIHEGKCIKSNTLTLYSLPNNFGYSRVGISIPTKSGNAVVRNKIKRQIRAILSKEFDFSSSFDYIIIARRSYDIDNIQQTQTDIVKLLKK